MPKSKEDRLNWAALDGELEKVTPLLRDPSVDVNWRDEDGRTALYNACANSHLATVEYLLSHPKIDPKLANNNGATPFFVACEKGHRSVVSLLLADPRVDPNKPKNSNSTPLWVASQSGHLAVVQVMLASGREIDTKTKSSFNNRTAAEQGRAMGSRTKGANESEEDYLRRKTNSPKCADLIDADEKDPATTRSQLRKQLGLPGLSFLFI
jgi:ankyrin repeat protein